MNLKTRGGALLGVLAASAILGGMCGCTAPEPAPPPEQAQQPPQQQSEASMILTLKPGTSYAEAGPGGIAVGWGGTVRLIEDCLAVDFGDGDPFLAVLFEDAEVKSREGDHAVIRLGPSGTLETGHSYRGRAVYIEHASEFASLTNGEECAARIGATTGVVIITVESEQ